MLTMVKTVSKPTSKSKIKGITKKRRSNPSSGLKGYSTAMRFLSTFTDYERLSRIGYNNNTFNLSRMQKLLSMVGNPHRKFKSVHIAGTKGKGSTAHMVANMLEGSGYKVGLYTSPHVVDMRERIMINNHMIPEHDFVRLLNKLAADVARRERKEPADVLRDPDLHRLSVLRRTRKWTWPSLRRAWAAGWTAPTSSSRRSARLRPSATTTCTSWATPWRRSRRKRPGSSRPASRRSASRRPPEVKEALAKVARINKAPLKFTGEDIDFSYRFESSRITGRHTRICLTTPRSKFEHLPVPLPGEHQAINCGLALAMLDALKEKGYQINDELALEGLAKTRLAGRMELVCEDPRVLIDGAHNPPSVEALIRAIGQHISYDSMVVIFGCAADKDVDGMLDQIAMGADKVIFTKNGTMRSADPEELALRFEERTGRMAQWADNVGEALRVAGSVATRGDIICVTGSFYLAGEAKRLYLARSGHASRN